jgi:hypothetical protein
MDGKEGAVRLWFDFSGWMEVGAAWRRDGSGKLRPGGGCACLFIAIVPMSEYLSAVK